MKDEELSHLRMEYYCPLVGTGSEVDPRKPLIAHLLKRNDWTMLELSDGKNCIVSVWGSQEDLHMLDNNPDCVRLDGSDDVELLTQYDEKERKNIKDLLKFSKETNKMSFRVEHHE